MEQTGIDTKYQNEFDGIINSIESRVQKLKGSEGAEGSAPAGVAQSKPEEKSDESEDEETTVKKIIEKVNNNNFK